jgi:hypothetical protein
VLEIRNRIDEAHACSFCVERDGVEMRESAHASKI